MTKNLGETPALELAQRAGFHDAHFIAFFGFAFLIMSIELGRLLDNFLELGVGHSTLDFDDDGFIHLCGDDFADASLT